MLNDIQNALACCDTKIVKKKIILKMKYPHIDRSISEIRYKNQYLLLRTYFFERDFNMFEKINRVLICKLKFYGDVLLNCNTSHCQHSGSLSTC